MTLTGSAHVATTHRLHPHVAGVGPFHRNAEFTKARQPMVPEGLNMLTPFCTSCSGKLCWNLITFPSIEILLSFITTLAYCYILHYHILLINILYDYRL
jgi:hypothetical protein